MNARQMIHKLYRTPALLVLALPLVAGNAAAVTYNLVAMPFFKTMPDGASVAMWGYALDGASPVPSVPGPALVVPPGDTSLTVNLRNTLPEPASVVIPGQTAVMTPVKFTDSTGRQRVRSFTAEAAARVGTTDGTQSYLSRPCTVSVFDKPVITQQPQSLTVVEGGNACFTVAAISATPLRYQWRFNGNALANETNSTLCLTNVQAENQGLYDVVVSDSFGSTNSQVATLTVLLKPSVTQIVTNYTVVQGGSVTLSVETSGTLPMSYRWRRNNSILKTDVLSSHQSFLVLTNVQPDSAGTSNRYWVTLTNAAQITPAVISPNIYLTVLADSDGDGMDDPWEARYPTASEPEGDADADGQKNK